MAAYPMPSAATRAAAQAFSPIVPATARGIATRRKLMDAAEKEFGDRGFHTASVSSITTRADVGQGTFYLYFHSKEEIFTALVREIGQALRAYTAKAAVGIKPRMNIERASMVAFFEFAQQHPGLFRIVQECQFVDEPVFREYYAHLAQSYAEALHSAAARNEIAPGDAQTRAWAIMGICHFIGMRDCLWDQRVPDSSTIDHIMDLIGSGMAPRK